MHGKLWFFHDQFFIVFFFFSIKAVADVRAVGKVCILDIDMQGVRSIKKTDLNPVYVFMKPPSIDVLVSDW